MVFSGHNSPYCEGASESAESAGTGPASSYQYSLTDIRVKQAWSPSNGTLYVVIFFFISLGQVLPCLCSASVYTETQSFCIIYVRTVRAVRSESEHCATFLHRPRAASAHSVIVSHSPLVATLVFLRPDFPPLVVPRSSSLDPQASSADAP